MKFRPIDKSEPMWNDPEPAREPRAKSLDELVQLRTSRKKLADVTLPDGFRLVTPTPVQAWVDHQMVWVFILGWAPVKDFTRDLEAAEVPKRRAA